MKYKIYVSMPVSFVAEADAETIEDALDKVAEMPVQTLCIHCSGTFTRGEPVWHIAGALDGEPTSSPLVDLSVDGKYLSNEEVEKVSKEQWG